MQIIFKITKTKRNESVKNISMRTQVHKNIQIPNIYKYMNLYAKIYLKLFTYLL